MTSFVIRKRSETLDIAHPMTIIATHKTIGAALDALSLDDVVRKQADHLWAVEKTKNGTLYHLAGDDVVRLSCIVLDDPKSRHLPIVNVFQLRKSLKRDHFDEDNAQFLIFLA